MMLYGIVWLNSIFINEAKWRKRKDDYDDYNDEDSIDSNEADGIPDAAKNNIEKQDEAIIEDEFGAKDYRLQMILKPDCASRPLWVVSFYILIKFDKKIILIYLIYDFYRHQMDIFFWNPFLLCTNMLMIF